MLGTPSKSSKSLLKGNDKVNVSMMNWNKPVANVKYSVANYSWRTPGSLVDCVHCGANGGIGGDNTQIIAHTVVIALACVKNLIITG